MGIERKGKMYSCKLFPINFHYDRQKIEGPVLFHLPIVWNRMTGHESQHSNCLVTCLPFGLLVNEWHDIQRASLMNQTCIQCQWQVPCQQQPNKQVAFAPWQGSHKRLACLWLGRMTVSEFPTDVLSVRVRLGGVCRTGNRCSVTKLGQVESAQVHGQREDWEQEAEFLVSQAAGTQHDIVSMKVF